jgi:hypothetical protein
VIHLQQMCVVYFLKKPNLRISTPSPSRWQMVTCPEHLYGCSNTSCWHGAGAAFQPIVLACR